MSTPTPGGSAENENERPSLSSQVSDAILRRAKEMSARYRLTLEQTGTGEYQARLAELPGLRIYGVSASEAEQRGRDALVVAIATMLEVGAAPPPPLAERRAQVNVRLSQEDRAFLESISRERGFSSLSEFVREAAMAFAAQQGTWGNQERQNRSPRAR